MQVSYIVVSPTSIREVSSSYKLKDDEIRHVVEDTLGVIASTLDYFRVVNNYPDLPSIEPWTQEEIDTFEAEGN
jgi:hypothetical protein